MLLQTDKEIENEVISYFQDLFSSNGGEQAFDYKLITRHLGEEDIIMLDQPFTKEEVISAIKHMYLEKAPCPDDMHALFFQIFWHFIGDDSFFFALEVLNEGLDIQAINHIHITLILKISNPTLMSHFRPISLCNVLYKIISKVSANRLKKVMNDIIDETQSALLSNSLIMDNAIVAFEIFHSLQNHPPKHPSMAIKLDMRKAFDRVEWNYLESLMHSMRFLRKFLSLIMDCLHFVSSSILINGVLFESFSPNRDIRQGDPISPYLFILCAEKFSFLQRVVEEKGELTGYPKGQGPTMSHLPFANDSLHFAKADPQQATVLTYIFSSYERLSGQTINSEKSSIFFNKNTPVDMKESIFSQLCMAISVGKKSI